MRTTRSAASEASEAPLRCPICLDDLRVPVSTACNHHFCEGCVREALQVKKECPTCRAPIVSHRSLRPVHTLAPATEEGWECNACTITNPLTARRCDCGARRPASVLAAGPLCRHPYDSTDEEDGEIEQLELAQLETAAGQSITEHQAIGNSCAPTHMVRPSKRPRVREQQKNQPEPPKCLMNNAASNKRWARTIRRAAVAPSQSEAGLKSVDTNWTAEEDAVLQAHCSADELGDWKRVFGTITCSLPGRSSLVCQKRLARLASEAERTKQSEANESFHGYPLGKPHGKEFTERKLWSGAWAAGWCVDAENHYAMPPNAVATSLGP